MTLSWMLNRMKAMPLPELAYRLKLRMVDTVMKRLGRNIHDGIKSCEILFPFSLHSAFPGSGNADIIALADMALAGRYHFFGMDVPLPADGNWSTDPLTGREWPKAFHATIDYRMNDVPGDPKVIWEIARHQYLVPVALAARLTNEGKYRQFVLDTISSWIGDNPPLYGIHWVGAMEMGIRLTSWIFALHLLQEETPLSESEKRVVSKSIRQQATVVSSRLSLYSSANNHLIGELTGLLAAALFLDCRESKKWIEKTVDMLNTQVDVQFHPDGVNREHAINYQCHTMDYYLLSIVMLRYVGRDLHPHVHDILKKACGFLEQVTDTAGWTPNMGDEDDGLVLPVAGRYERVIDTLCLAGGVLDGYVSPFRGKGQTLRSSLLIGVHAAPECVRERPSDEEDWLTLHEGGYSILRTQVHGKALFVLFDHAPFGMAPLFAHGHSDLLSICLSYGGKPFLIDPGTYKYYLADRYREYMKSAMAHNTLVLDGENQAESTGRFMWRNPPVVRMNKLGGGQLIAEHDGYLQRFGVVHKREVRFEGNALHVTDQLLGEWIRSAEKVMVLFHLHPQVVVFIDRNGVCLTHDSVSITLNVKGCQDLVVAEGETVPELLGWYSASYYHLQNCKTLCLTFPVAVNVPYSIDIVMPDQ